MHTCAASSSILLITLVGRVLPDVPVASLLIEVLALRNRLLDLEIGIGAWPLVAPLFRRHGRHLGRDHSPFITIDFITIDSRRDTASLRSSAWAIAEIKP